ncbi:hypothetical protein ACOSP7_013208 [Xanthoceras sorbifolium]
MQVPVRVTISGASRVGQTPVVTRYNEYTNVVTLVNESNIEGIGGNIPDIQDVFHAIQSLKDDVINLNKQVDGMGSRVREAEENDIKGSNECDKRNELNEGLGSPRTRVPNLKKQDVVAIGARRHPVIQVASSTETGSLHEKNETELAALVLSTLLTGNAEDKNSTGPTVDEVKLNIERVVGGVVSAISKEDGDKNIGQQKENDEESHWYGPFELSFRLNTADDVIVRYIFNRDLPKLEIISQLGGVRVSRHSIQTLEPGRYLNDEDIAGSIHRNYRFSGLHISVQSSTPKQTNLFDCGVYVCKYCIRWELMIASLAVISVRYTSQRQKLWQTREGCRAAMRVNYEGKKNKWVVKEFVTEHSHILSKPIHTQFLR